MVDIVLLNKVEYNFSKEAKDSRECKNSEFTITGAYW